MRTEKEIISIFYDDIKSYAISFAKRKILACQDKSFRIDDYIQEAFLGVLRAWRALDEEQQQALPLNKLRNYLFKWMYKALITYNNDVVFYYKKLDFSEIDPPELYYNRDWADSVSSVPEPLHQVLIEIGLGCESRQAALLLDENPKCFGSFLRRNLKIRKLPELYITISGNYSKKMRKNCYVSKSFKYQSDTINTPIN